VTVLPTGTVIVAGLNALFTTITVVPVGLVGWVGLLLPPPHPIATAAAIAIKVALVTLPPVCPRASLRHDLSSNFPAGHIARPSIRRRLAVIGMNVYVGIACPQGGYEIVERDRRRAYGGPIGAGYQYSIAAAGGNRSTGPAQVQPHWPVLAECPNVNM
jgi:hypothetical protein